MQSNIENLVTNTIANLKNIVDVGSIVGQPIYVGATTIVPIAKVTFGFLSGGGEYGAIQSESEENAKHAGGSGGGVNINPIGFLILEQNKKSFVKVDKETEGSKWMELAQTALSFVKKD